MKFKSMALGLVAALFAIVGCTNAKDDPSSKAASVEITSDDEIDVPQGGGSATVTFISTRDWKIKNCPSWLVAEPEKGKASLSEQTVTFTALANEGMDRSATVLIYAGTANAEVIISQKGTKEAIPQGEGTVSKPYSASQAHDLALALADGAMTDKPVYVRGIIHKLHPKEHTEAKISQYGNGSFYISDDGQHQEGDKDFLCFQVYYTGGVKFTSVDQVKVGDDVVIYGKLKNFGGTPETDDKGSAYIYTLNGKGAEAKEMTIAQAIAAKDGLAIVTGRVIASSTGGFVINDGTENNMFVPKAGHSQKVGDIVKVTGPLNDYGKCIRLGDANDKDNIKVEASSASIPATPDQTPVVVLQTGFSAFDCGGSAKLVTIAGGVLKFEFDKDDPSIKYYNLDYGTGVKPAGSVYTGRDLDSYLDKKLKVTGYFCGKTSNWFMVMETDIQLDGSKSFNVTPATVTVGSAAGSKGSISVSGDVAWTASASSTDVTLSPSSGTGAATIDVTLAENTTYQKRTYKVTVSTTEDALVKSYEVTVNQDAAVDPSLKVVELTNEEIVASFKASTVASNIYGDWTISSASGSWTGNMNTLKELVYVQIRNKGNAHIMTPAFSSDIEKIEIEGWATYTGSNAAKRNIYAIAADYSLPTGTTDNDQYNKLSPAKEDIPANAYGSVLFNGNKDNLLTETITFSKSGVKQCKIVSYDGAVFIKSIKVYLK